VFFDKKSITDSMNKKHTFATHIRYDGDIANELLNKSPNKRRSFQMTKIKRGLIIGSVVLALGATSLTAFAVNEPAAEAAPATVCTAENKAERLQDKKDFLAAKVQAGTMTQEKADEIIAALESAQETCDGTGSAKIGQKFGAGFGGMNGKGQGNNGNCNGTGERQGNRQGNQGQGNCGNCAD